MANKNIVMILAKPASGKTWSLKEMKNPEGICYANCDLKELPFKSEMNEEWISDPMDILPLVEAIENEESIHTGVIDTVNHLMEMYETQYVLSSNDTRAAWGQYGAFYKDMLHSIKSGTKDYALMCHTEVKENEETGQSETKGAIKGAVGRRGIEGDMTTVLMAKRITVKEAKKWENDLLQITEENEEDGFVHVFQTRPDKHTMGEPIRCPDMLFSRKEKYISNNLDSVFDRLKAYYS